MPSIYHNLTSRVKNKTLKGILNSDAAHIALNKQLKQQIDVLMSQGISNFEINKFFENETNQDLKNNYMGYIHLHEIIKKRNAKYSFAIFNTAKHNKPSMHLWSFMDIHRKRNLLLFGLDDSNSLL